MIARRLMLPLAAASFLLSRAPSAAGQDVVVVPQHDPGATVPHTPAALPPGYAPPSGGAPVPGTYPGPYEQLDPTDYRTGAPQYVERSTSIKALWIPGAIVFGASYGLSAAFGSLSTSSEYTTWSAIPILGPWVALGYASYDAELLGSIIGGIAELAGFTMFVLGLTLKRSVRVPLYSFDPRDPRAPVLALAPLASRAGSAVGLSLTHF